MPDGVPATSDVCAIHTFLAVSDDGSATCMACSDCKSQAIAGAAERSVLWDSIVGSVRVSKALSKTQARDTYGARYNLAFGKIVQSHRAHRG